MACMVCVCKKIIPSIPTLTRSLIGGQSISSPTTTYVGPNGIDAVVSTVINVADTFIDICIVHINQLYCSLVPGAYRGGRAWG